MTAFSYKAIKQQNDDQKHVAADDHIVRITRVNALANSADDPMAIFTFTIEDEADDDNGKEFPGFISFPDMFNDMQLASLEQFMTANACDWGTLNDHVIDVPFLKAWAAQFIGNLLRVESGYGSGKNAGKPIAKNYYALDGASASQGLIDLD